MIKNGSPKSRASVALRDVSAGFLLTLYRLKQFTDIGIIGKNWQYIL
jgi:hypothetical protein